MSLEDGGKSVPIFAGKGSFRLELEDSRIWHAHLGDAEAIAAGWLLHAIDDIERLFDG